MWFPTKDGGNRPPGKNQMEELCGQEIFQFQESASVFLERQWRQFLGVNQWLWVCPFLPQVTVPCHSITYQPGGGQKPSLNSHPPRQNYKIVKTLIPLRKPLDRMAQTFFRWPQRLIKQMLHGLHYIFLWQTLTPPQHVFGDEKPFCVFLFLLPHFHLVAAVVNLR